LIFGVLDAFLQVIASFLILEMVSGKPLFTGVSDQDQIKKIFKIRGTPDDKTYPDLKNLPEWDVIILIIV